MTRTTNAPSLHDLLQFMDQASAPLHLQHLDIGNSFVRLNSTTVHHLRRLTSLHIHNALEPTRDPVVRGARGLFIRCGTVADDILEKQRAVGSSMNQFWVDLSHAGIHLQEIELNNIVPGFMQYLTTYSGLKKLAISTILFQTTAESEVAATQFFADPFKLANHSDTLEYLSINVTYEGLWCVGQHNVYKIAQLNSLRVLEVAVSKADLGQSAESGQGSANGHANIIVG